MTYAEFASELGLTLTLEPWVSETRAGWEPGSSHWTAIIADQQGRELTTPYSQGSAIREQPTLGDVLMAVALDARLYEDGEDVYGFAENLGLDMNDRKTQRDYEACRDEAEDLRRVLGTEQYQRLLFSGEVTE